MATAIGDEQPRDLPTAALAYKTVTFETEMANADYLNSIECIATWRPILPDGWFYLGQGASGYIYSYPHVPPSGVIAHELEDGALADIVEWERLQAVSLWRGVPPSDDYAVIGCIYSTNPNNTAPDSVQTYGIKAIRRDLLKIGKFENGYYYSFYAYNKPVPYASVWFVHTGNGIRTGAIIPTRGLDPPISDLALTLDPDKVLNITSSSTTAEGDATTSESADT